MKTSLPIDGHLSKIATQIQTHKLFVLKASPGSGKTTRLPPFLLQHFSKKILVLEPRRLAAKFSAKRIAEESGVELGREVGYQFRFEKKISEQSRLIFYTEGTFLRYLMNNPSLSGVDVVILDEFHERHKETDLAWALLRKIQKEKRPDLHLVVMSATLDKKLFPEESLSYEVEAPLFPLTIHYSDNQGRDLPIEKKVARAFWKGLDFEGDILIFLPGMKEILKVEEELRPLAEENLCDLCVLHGDLSNEEQARVMQEGGKRKVILSTNIAESSLTIPGVRIVIDSGLYRQASFSPWTGLSNLETKKHSRSSAIQRAGRAGRTGPGEVLRLFSKEDYEERMEYEKPELLRADLAETLLFVARLGIKDFSSLPWIEHPSTAALERSLQFLHELGAMKEGEITGLGLEMAEYPLHPRLSRILVEASHCGAKKTEEMIAFISSLEENSFQRKNLSTQLRSLTQTKVAKTPKDIPLEKLLLCGFIDRIVSLLEDKEDQVLLINGEMLRLSYTLRQELDKEEKLQFVVSVSSSGEILRLVPLKEEWLYDLKPFPIEEKRSLLFDERRKALVLVEQLRLGRILLSETKKRVADLVLSEDEKKTARELMKKEFLKLLLELENEASYKRLHFLKKIFPEIWKADALEDFLEAKACDYIQFGEEEREAFLFEYREFFLRLFDPEHQLKLESFLPEKIVLSDRRSLLIQYDEEPWVSSYIQDFYGLSESFKIAEGRYLLTLHLLGPHKRALQITKDLKSFWKNTYTLLHKELSRDYPKHHWPLEPEKAKPVLLKKHLLGP